MNNRLQLAIAIVAVLMAGAVGLAVAQSGGSGEDTFYACAKPNGKVRPATIRVNVEPTCKTNQTLVSWNSSDGVAAGGGLEEVWVPPRFAVIDSPFGGGEVRTPAFWELDLDRYGEDAAMRLEVGNGRGCYLVLDTDTEEVLDSFCRALVTRPGDLSTMGQFIPLRGNVTLMPDGVEVFVQDCLGISMHIVGDFDLCEDPYVPGLTATVNDVPDCPVVP